MCAGVRGACTGGDDRLHVEERAAQVAEEHEHNHELAYGDEPTYCDELILQCNVTAHQIEQNNAWGW